MAKPRSATVLVVEDDPAQCRILAAVLRDEGYRVEAASTGGEALRLITESASDVAIVDILLGAGPDGLTVTRSLRLTHPRRPHLDLSVLDETEQVLAGFAAGPDDYMTKPFDTLELLARLKAVARRHEEADADPVLTLGNLKLDRSTRLVTVGERLLHLTRTEYDLMRVLVENRDRVISK